MKENKTEIHDAEKITGAVHCVVWAELSSSASAVGSVFVLKQTTSNLCLK